jgi:hypothetical protein
MIQEIITTEDSVIELYMNDINELNFKMLKKKLQDKEEGEGWSQQLCNETEIEYKRFLALKRAYPDKDIVPNEAIDKFWHRHILDTHAYAKDCELIFEYFLHHFPYFGMSGKADAKNLIDAFEETKRLYELHFGLPYIGGAKRCTAPKCRTQCKPMKCK